MSWIPGSRWPQPAGDADAFRVLYRAAAQGHEEHGPVHFRGTYRFEAWKC